jgi:23S rRNA pseudouridine2605 synthase
MPLERLQKIIAAAGICSRRAAEELITAGRVRVNGPAITELGVKADPETDEILVDGKPLRRATPHVYLMLNKPRGTVTTVDDPEGRPTVMEFLKHIKERIYPVGRLDFHSEGLLLFTNDGEFANRILSTGFGVNKTYWAKVHGTPDAEALQKLREGIMMDGRLTLPAEIRPLPSQGRGEDWREAGKKRKVAAKSRKPRYESDDEDDHDDGNPWFEVILQEGRQNQIRRMFELVGHPVRKLRRVRIGRLSLGPLKPGEFRHLLPGEVSQLMAGERENSLSAPRPRKTAADFRKRFSRATDEASSEHAGDPIDSSQGAGSAPTASPDVTPNREEQPAARRPFERRPERPPQSRFTERTTNRPERSRYERPQRSGFGEHTPYRSDRPQGSRPSADRPRSDRPRSDRPGGDRTRTDFSRPKFPRQPSERSSSERPPFERRPYAGDRPERRPFGRDGAERGRFGRDRENRPFTPRPPRSDSPSYNQGSASRSGSAPFGRPPGRGARPGAPPRRDDHRPDDRPRNDRPMERGRPMRNRGPSDRGGAIEGRSGDRQRPIVGRPMGRATGDRPQGRPMQPRGGEERPRESRPPGTRPFERRPFAPRPFQDRPGSDRPRGPRAFGGRPGGGNPPPRGPRSGASGGLRSGPPKSGPRTDARTGLRPPNPRADRRPSGPRKPLPDEERS